MALCLVKHRDKFTFYLYSSRLNTGVQPPPETSCISSRTQTTGNVRVQPTSEKAEYNRKQKLGHMGVESSAETSCISNINQIMGHVTEQSQVSKRSDQSAADKREIIKQQ
jgi:hypothetical protein